MVTSFTNVTLGLIGPLGTTEVIILAILGLLIFGRRLPEVGRSLGKGIVEFKKGLSGIEDDIDTTASQQPRIEQPKDSVSMQDKQAESEPTKGAHHPSA